MKITLLTSIILSLSLKEGVGKGHSLEKKKSKFKVEKNIKTIKIKVEKNLKKPSVHRLFLIICDTYDIKFDWIEAELLMIQIRH